MKKPMLNIAISTALTATVVITPMLSTHAYADDFEPEASVNESENTTENYTLSGMGVGAATGTVIAGPAGLIIGSIIGAFIGSNKVKEPDNEPIQTSINAEVVDTTESKLANTASNDVRPPGGKAVPHLEEQHIHLAQIGPINSVSDTNLETQQEGIMNILVSDLSLDVYFRSGSTDIESFYPVRLAAIANLMNAMEKLEIHLDGYTDRRGNKTQNALLANQRIDKVREHLINAGIEENRITSKAFGEAKMKSSAGDLDAYTFDRRVVIRFEQARTNTDKTMAAKPSITRSISMDPVSTETISRF